MQVRHVPLLTAVVLVLASSTAFAQPRPGQSGSSLPPGGPRSQVPASQLAPPEAMKVDDVREFLASRRPGIKPQDIDPELLKKLMETMGKEMPRDQKVDPKQVEKMLQEDKRFKDPAFLKQLEKLLESKDFPKNIEGKLPKDDPRPPAIDDPKLGEKMKQVIENGQKGGGPPVMPKGDAQDPNINPQAVKPPEPNPDDRARENEWVQWLDKHFKDSPAADAAMKDLINAVNKQDSAGMFDRIPEFRDGAWKDMDGWGKVNPGDYWKIKPPNISGTGISPPKIDGGGSGGGNGGGGGGGGSGIGGGGGAGLGGGGMSLAVIAGIAAAVFLAILVFRRWKLIQAERAAAQAHGIPGGIDFDAIRTREQLVRAFDTVSLDQCGDEARSWNHRVIADQLGETRPAVADPAIELAGLYERARYAPLDEDLAPGEFADARRDLRVVAGVAA
ncbi:MAG TPA: DUF4129 domain-containing protein [Gemmataceae bacterium]|nr:DUF4129 domain-containing protein [Gemmataceae bacterium]